MATNSETSPSPLYDIKTDDGRHYVSDLLHTADAEFIVRACNAHYELLAACRAMEETLTARGWNDTSLAHVRAIIKAAEGSAS